MIAFDIDVSLQTPQWETAIADIETLCVSVITTTLKKTLINHPKGEVSLVLADDAFIQTLNAQYRGKDKPTNVLSFPLTTLDDLTHSDYLALGDIIIAYETIAREAQDQNKPLRHHVTHMLVHGCLHLLHYDHETPEDAETMENIEIEILRLMNIKNPYEIA